MNIRMILSFAFISTTLSISGCHSYNQHSWQKDPVQRSQSQQDLATCTYEAESATATIGTSNHPKSTSEAISGGISDGVEAGMEQSELIERCMEAKGYRH